MALGRLFVSAMSFVAVASALPAGKASFYDQDIWNVMKLMRISD